ncbi:MAG: hypothetical protein N3D82_03640 [Ignisphaera sp.]|nr:hypothetical protein [Ignisphaera sp.]MCX8168099.1 hypothetical protein [Ignisphaera sp.]MDW8086230.1 hypothetical protein [Ignisphaera sp.]
MALELLFSRMIKGSTSLKKNDIAGGAIEDRIKRIEDDIVSVANILANIMLIGKEKGKRCLFFSSSEGICRYWRLDIDIPTLNLAKGQDGYYVKIVQHPELCAVCSYWREGVYK